MRHVVVVDTNVLFSGLWSRMGASHRVLELILEGNVCPALSVPLVLEYEMVLKRESAALGRTAREIEGLLDYLCRIGQHQEIHFLWRPTLRDPRDELVLELAVAARCEYIVTHNTRDFVGTDLFGVTPLTPGAFLRILGEQP